MCLAPEALRSTIFQLHSGIGFAPGQSLLSAATLDHNASDDVDWIMCEARMPELRRNACGGLSVLWFSITVECQAPVRFAEHERGFKGGIVHGMFEHAITDCSRSLFLQLSEKANSRRSRYALFPPLDRKRHYRTGEEIKFGVVLFGAACEVWDDVLAALLSRGALTLGAGRSVLWVMRIEALHPHRIPQLIFDRQTGYLEDEPGNIAIAPANGARADSAVLQFLTPVTVSSAAQRARSLDAIPLSLKRCVRALRRRVSELEPSLAGQYGFDSDDWAALEHHLRDVAISRTTNRLVEWRYGSSTKPRPVTLRGQLGKVEYRGDIPAPVVSLLQLGEWTGMGQRTTLGQGWYRFTHEIPKGAVRVESNVQDAQEDIQ